MKRILRLASVFALSCAALLYTGCAKDYSEDITAIQKQQTEQDNKLATQAEQIAKLQEADLTLQKQLTSLEATLAETAKKLQTAYEELKAADQSNKELIDALTTRVAVLEQFKSDLEKEMSSIKSTIESIQKTLSEKTTDIENLKTQIASALEKIGTISGKMEAYEQAISSIQNQIATIQGKITDNYNTLIEKITAVKEIADANAATLQTVLGEITSIKEYFNNYYTKAEVDAFVKTLQDNINALDSKIQAQIAENVKELQAKDTELAGQISALDSKVMNLITALQAKDEELAKKHAEEVAAIQEVIKGINAEIATIKSDISTLQTQVQQLIADVSVLQDAVTNLQAVDQSLQEQIAATNEALDAAYAALDAVDKTNAAAIAALEGRVAILENNVAALQSKDKEILAAIEKINNTLVELQSGVKTNAEKIETVNNTLTATIQSLGELKGLVEANRKAFDDFVNITYSNYTKETDAAIALLNENLSKLTERVDAIEADLVKVWGEIDWIKKNFDNYYDKTWINGAIEGINNTINTLAARLDKADAELKAQIEALREEYEAKVKELEAKDAELTAAIEELKVKIQEEAKAREEGDLNTIKYVDAEIAKIQKQIDEKINPDIKKLQEDLNALTVRVDVLEGKVKNIEEVDIPALEAADKVLQQNIDKVQENLDAAKEELNKAIKANADNIATLQKEVKELQELCVKLQDMDKELQNQINALKEELKTVKEDVAANAKSISDLSNTVSEFRAAYDKFVEDTNKSIEELNNAIQKNASDIATNAKAIEAINARLDEETTGLSALWAAIGVNAEAIVKTNARIDDIVNNDIPALKEMDKLLQENIDKVEKKLDDAKDELEKAIKANADNITELQGKVTALQSLCDGLKQTDEALKGQIEALEKKVDELNTQVNDKIDTLSKDIWGAVKAFKQEYEKAIAEINDAIKKNASDIAANAKDIEEIQALLEDKAEGLKALWAAIGVNAKTISDVAARVNSLSVYPTNHYEWLKVKVNNQSNNIFFASFQVEPASAAANVTKENLKVYFQSGLTRATSTRTEATPYWVTSNTTTGVVDVYVNEDVPGLLPGEKLYFAFSFTGSDDAGSYTTTSDYAAATEGTAAQQSEIDFAPKFFPGTSEAIITADTQADSLSGDYKSYVGKTATGFSKCSQVWFSKGTNYGEYQKPFIDAIFPDLNCKLEEFVKITGIEVEVEYNVSQMVKRDSYPWRTKDDACWFLSDNFADSSVVVFKNSVDSLQKYVGKWCHLDSEKGGLKMIFRVNGSQITTPYWYACYDITKVKSESNPINLYMYWNYTHWDWTTRKDLIEDVEKLDAFVANIKPATTWADLFNNTIEDTYSSTFMNNTYVPTAQSPSHLELINAKQVGVVAQQKLISSGMTPASLRQIRSNDTDEYTIPVSYGIDPVPTYVVEESTFAAIGSISKPTVIKIGGFVNRFVEDNWDALVHGLGYTKDANKKDVYEDVYKNLSANAYEYTLDGTALSGVTQQLYRDLNYEFVDTLLITVPAGNIKYTDNKSLQVNTTIYGVTYTNNVKVTTGAPKFYLAYNPKYVTSGKANVRGHFVNKLYTIDEMYYTHYWTVEGTFEDEDIANLDGNVQLYFQDVDYEETSDWGTRETDHGTIKYENITLAKAGVDAVPQFIIPSDKKMTWNTYKATTFTLSPRIYINGEDATIETGAQATVRKPVNFIAPYPFMFDESIKNELEATRTANQDLKFCIWLGLGVKGTYDDQGVKWTDNLIHTWYDKDNNPLYYDWVEDYKYSGSKLDFGEAQSTITAYRSDGATFTLVKDHDYNYNDGEGTITIQKESAVSGTFYFYVTVDVRNDFDHCGSDTKVITKTIKITVVQE